ncbi:MAG: DUF835 domain-containing protein [Candidatus Methanoperedens sp.]|nr:DUF835 domain-containing protein [Candidatus Methanoperedens sp.]
MLSTLISVMLSLISVFIYVGLGAFVLKKNPRERTNFIFVLLMLVFIIWSMGTYNIGIMTENAPLEEILLFMKLQLSGVIISITLFVMFALYVPKKENPLKNPLTYISLIFSLYLLNLILTINTSALENNIFLLTPQNKLDFFLYSAVFGIAGVYVLLRHYMTSKYSQKEQANIIIIGSFLAILVAVVSNIILPLFFNIYLLPLSSLAPALMGVFFAYAVYKYGLHIKAVPELSITSFCGVECKLCSQYLDKKCSGCRYDDSKYRNCDVYRCVTKKGYRDCGVCNEILDCVKRTENTGRCFTSKPGLTDEIPEFDLRPGQTYFVKDEGYEKFLCGIKSGIYGLILSTMNPLHIREKYGVVTTPIVWISDEAFEDGVSPKNLKRLETVIINFMKEIENAVILLDDIDSLISINGYENVQHVVQTLTTMTQTTNNILIIQTKMEDDELQRMKPLYFKRRSPKQEPTKKNTKHFM